MASLPRIYCSKPRRPGRQRCRLRQATHRLRFMRRIANVIALPPISAF